MRNRVVRLSAVQAKLQAQANEDLARRGPVAIVPHLLLLPLMAMWGDQWREIPRVFAGFCFYICAMCACRVLPAFRKPGASRAGDALTYTLLKGNIFAICMGWGCFCAVVMQRYELTHWNAFAALVLPIAIGNASLTTVISHYGLFVADVLACLMPVTAVLVVRGGAKEWVVTAALIMDAVYLIIQGRRLYRSYRTSLYNNALLEAKMRELEIAQRNSEQASLAKSQFLANMSHELRTPMNGVLGMTALTLETQLSAEQREYLEAAHSAGRSLLKLMNEVLDFSHMDAGRLDLKIEPVRLRSLLEEVRCTFLPDVRQNGLSLEAQIDPEVPEFLLGDEVRLRQVLINLVANAVKFTEKGGVVLAASLKSLEPGAVLVEFMVRDTGPGVAPEMQKAIFEPFVQGDGSSTRRFGGAGLGLAISTRIVEKMGGRIALESAPGRGSTFRFEAIFQPAPMTQPDRAILGS